MRRRDTANLLPSALIFKITLHIVYSIAIVAMSHDEVHILIPILITM